MNIFIKTIALCKFGKLKTDLIVIVIASLCVMHLCVRVCVCACVRVCDCIAHVVSRDSLPFLDFKQPT